MGQGNVIDKGITYAMALCSRREYSEYDISLKLKKRGLDDDDIARAIQSLVSNKFVDNLRYARAFTRDKSIIDGWGRRKIEYALRAKNIGQEIIMEALSEADTSDGKRRMFQVLANKWGSIRGDSDQIRAVKLFRFGAGRGYSYEQINGFLVYFKSNNKS